MGRKSGGEALLAKAKSSMSKAKTLEGLISIPRCHVTNNYNCTLKQSVLRLMFL